MTNHPSTPPSRPAEGDTVIFDVDGTLVDSTYHHALAWHRAFKECSVDVPLLRPVLPGREAACHYSEEVLGARR